MTEWNLLVRVFYPEDNIVEIYMADLGMCKR